MLSFSPKYKARGFSETWSLSSRTMSPRLRVDVCTFNRKQGRKVCQVYNSGLYLMRW